MARPRRRFKRTTDSEHAWPVAPNVVAQDFTAEAPDRKWGADISYIWTAEGWLYLAVMIDGRRGNDPADRFPILLHLASGRRLGHE